MLSPIESYVRFLEETNDKDSAYFSFTVDNSGEQGIIKANKEGLRLYAAQLLRKSIEMEEKQDGQPLHLEHPDWLISDAGYDMITGIEPRYTSRGDILRETNQAQFPFSGSGRSTFFLSALMITTAMAIGLCIRYLPLFSCIS